MKNWGSTTAVESSGWSGKYIIKQAHDEHIMTIKLKQWWGAVDIV